MKKICEWESTLALENGDALSFERKFCGSKQYYYWTYTPNTGVNSFFALSQKPKESNQTITGILFYDVVKKRFVFTDGTGSKMADDALNFESDIVCFGTLENGILCLSNNYGEIFIPLNEG